MARFCPYCQNPVYEDAIKCMSCGKSLKKRTAVCSVCNKEDIATIAVMDREYCEDCFQELVNKVKITTTHSFEGGKILRYIDIETVEVALGTGLMSEFQAGVADFFGSRATGFENKLQQSKIIALGKIKAQALIKGGNALVGVHVSYNQFAANVTAVIVSGTIVEIVFDS